MSLYRLHLSWKGKEVVLRARELDMTHPYFVSIGDLVFPEGNSVIIDPSQDELRRTFGQAEHVMIPFQNVTLIEELREEEVSPDNKVRPFTVVDGSDETAADNEAEEQEDSEHDEDEPHDEGGFQE
jgi:hypothetical protein